jgi:hypothetical protein
MKKVIFAIFTVMFLASCESSTRENSIRELTYEDSIEILSNKMDSVQIVNYSIGDENYIFIVKDGAITGRTIYIGGDISTISLGLLTSLISSLIILSFIVGYYLVED